MKSLRINRLPKCFQVFLAIVKDNDLEDLATHADTFFTLDITYFGEIILLLIHQRR